MSVHDEDGHSAKVDAWLSEARKAVHPDRLVDAFEQAFGAMWRRARLTLGDVTLPAILHRVTYTAAERFPALSRIEVNATGLQSGKLRERAAGLKPEQLEEGIRFILVEFLTVLGRLTAEVLSPALHAELAKADASGKEGKP